MMVSLLMITMIWEHYILKNVFTIYLFNSYIYLFI